MFGLVIPFGPDGIDWAVASVWNVLDNGAGVLRKDHAIGRGHWRTLQQILFREVRQGLIAG